MAHSTNHRMRCLAVGFVVSTFCTTRSTVGFVTTPISRPDVVRRLYGFSPAKLSLCSREARPTFSPVMSGSSGQTWDLDSSKSRIIQNFLTQRSIQTMLHNMRAVGDTASFEFLDDFLGHKGLWNYHGYGGLKVDSESYLDQLKRSLPLMITKRTTAFRGGSRNNPFLTDVGQSYSSTVNPRNLASNLITMREVLSEEWIQDLPLLAEENLELMRHYTALVNHKKDDGRALQHALREQCDDHSPLRLATYDLLEKLVTDIAVKEVSQELQRGPASSRHAGRWLHGQHMFAGGGFHGDHGEDVGRNFMLHLLHSVPVIVTATPGGAPAFVDPLSVAQRVMSARERVADALAAALAETAVHHTRWTARLLESCFSRPAATTAAAGTYAASFLAAPPPRQQHLRRGGVRALPLRRSRYSSAVCSRRAATAATTAAKARRRRLA